MVSTAAASSNLSSNKPVSTSTFPQLLPPQPPVVFLTIYPLTLLLGSLYSYISPTAKPVTPHSSSVSPTDLPDSHVSQASINYFARKNNVFNVYFVKIGWLWTSVAFLSLIITQPAFTGKTSLAESRLRRVGQAVLRYLLVTLTWILTTQWFFGPPIIDRSFTATGGKCKSSLPLEPGHPGHSISNLETLSTSATCKASGGIWKGGHDVSGHVFMLVLASAFLVFELVGSLLSTDGVEGSSKDENTTSTSEAANDPSHRRKWSLNFVRVVIGLSWWMLFMTAIWFHTWQEKVSSTSSTCSRA